MANIIYLKVKLIYKKICNLTAMVKKKKKNTNYIKYLFRTENYSMENYQVKH